MGSCYKFEAWQSGSGLGSTIPNLRYLVVDLEGLGAIPPLQHQRIQKPPCIDIKIDYATF